VGLESDRRSLLPRAAIANVTLVRILANNEYYLPPDGLYSQAILLGSVSGPFVITGCVSESGVTVDSNVMTVTSSTESHTVRLPTGQRVTTDALVRFLRGVFSEIVVSNDNGYLAFADVANIGRESRITVSGRGAEAVGFLYQKAARGQQVYPGWVLDYRTDILPMVNRNGQIVAHARYPKFVEQVRQNPTFKVTYAAPPDRCPRCRGTFIENDWRFDPQGELILIDNENLLYQSALKIILTDRGSNVYHPLYGSLLKSRIGAKAVGAVATLLREDVQTALQRMQALQGQQAGFQQVTLKERLAAILSVEVMPHRSDPTAFLVDVVVSNASGEPVSITIVFSVPGAVALAGTNNLSLGLDISGLTPEESKKFFV